MKKYIFLSTIALLSLLVSQAQTNVSGGIYSNTTWTLANSPYIVTDTIVVFPNVTLTIEAGVVVKFDKNQEIEIRQAQLIANGTSTDSITFTSNSSSPTAGIYNGLYLIGGTNASKFSYCNLSFAANGIDALEEDSLIISNCNFYTNLTGLLFIGDTSGGNYGNIIIENSMFRSNASRGISFDALLSSTIDSCYFLYNGIGLDGGFFNKNNSVARNSIFNHNNTGLQGILNLLVDNCTITYNQTGISSGSENKIQNSIIDSNSVVGIIAIGDTVMNCSIKYNGNGVETKSSTIQGNDIEFNSGTSISDYATWTGSGSLMTENTIRYSKTGINDGVGGFEITENIVENNDTGIIINNSNSIVNCNRICGNTVYDLKYTQVNNFSAANNYWCTDSASLEALIYDGYDNINYGLVSFMPFDSSCSPVTSVNEISQPDDLITIYPNPATNELTVHTSSFLRSEAVTVLLLNVLGQEASPPTLLQRKGEDALIDVSMLSSGIYFIQLKSESVTVVGRFVKE